MFPREMGLKRAMCQNRTNLDRYITKLNGKADIYISLYSFTDASDKDNTAILDRAWWDFDMNDRFTYEQVKDDAVELLSRLTGDVRVCATGRGFHIHQLLETPVTGLHWGRALDRYQRTIAKGLSSLDGVGYPRKMCRVPHTYNAKRKRWAVMIDVDAFKANPHAYKIPTGPKKAFQHLHPWFGDENHSDFCLMRWVEGNPVDLQADISLPVLHDIDDVDGIPMIPCLSEAVAVSNPAHPIRVALAQHLFEQMRMFAPAVSLTQEQKNEMVDKATAYMESLNWQDFRAGITRKHLNTLITYDRSPSCAWFVRRGLCTAPCWRDDGSRDIYLNTSRPI